MKPWNVTTTITYAINAETAEDAIAIVDDHLEGDDLGWSWSLPVPIEEED